jgi:hypothetical protein
METLFEHISDIRTILTSAFSEILLVAGGGMLAIGWRMLRWIGRWRSLRRAFGNNVLSADDIAISLPLWRVLDCARDQPRFEKCGSTGEVRHLYGPDRTYAEADAGSAFAAAQTFSRYFSRPIEMRPEDSNLRSKETNLLIGAPVANRHVDRIMRAHRTLARASLLVDFVDQQEDCNTRAASFIRNLVTGDEYRFDGVTDYAVIQRLTKVEDGDGYHFIIAGIDASGTEAAGAALERHWKKFARSGGAAALVISLQRGHPETARVETWIYRSFGKWVIRRADGDVQRFPVKAPLAPSPVLKAAAAQAI